MNYPKSVVKLIECFESLPTIGKKSAERLAMYLITDLNEQDAQVFSEAILNVKHNIKRCSVCGNLSEKSECEICLDSDRDKKLIMVVESIKDVFILEKMKSYNGRYHVLNGAINFANGIGTEDIDIKGLLSRVEKENPQEIILATNANVEGETTARYLKKILEKYPVLVTRIAHGLPVGGNLQYADEMTLLKAFEGRRNY